MNNEFKLNLAFLLLVALVSFTIIFTQNIKFWEVPLVDVIEEISGETQEITQEQESLEEKETGKVRKTEILGYSIFDTIKWINNKANKLYAGLNPQSQNLSEGVLAIDTRKSIYLPKEEAFIEIAVLNSRGKPECDASITLEITDPAGRKTILTTASKTILIGDECQIHGKTSSPDFYTTYLANRVGKYIMKLTVITPNGERSIQDSFVVQSQVDFDVARQGPTRIYPFVPYTMEFAINANKDYNGPIVEYVPASFEITPKQGLRVTTQGDVKVLTWNKKLKKGETYTLAYEFDAPDISPEFYLTGPLQIGSFKEARQWQIASDATSVMRPNADGTNIAWTCADGTCGTGHYTVVDDPVLKPTVPTLADNVSSVGNNAREVFQTSSPSDVDTGSTTIDVQLFLYASTGDKRQIRYKICDAESGGGVDCTTEQTIGVNEAEAWYNTTIETINCATWVHADCQVAADALLIDLKQQQSSGGAGGTAFVFAAYINITYTAGAAPNVAPFVGNASINETLILLNEFVCLNATAHDPEGDPITVRARVWNTTNFVNFTMVDDGTTGCDGANADTIFGIVVQSGKTGTWNYTHAIANDSNGAFNTTIVNRRWNVTDIPEITTIDLDDDFVTPLDEIDLIAFGTRNVFCNGTVTDEDGGGDVSVVNATLHDTAASSPGAADANATHYTNQSCWLSSANGDFRSFECLFRVRYFANNQTWQCNATAYDSLNYQNSSRINATINELIALSVPATIDFGTLEPGETSAVNKTNITNAGNILIDLKIYGYANNFTTSDNALNCTTSTGLKNNISLYYLRYNVTDLPTCSSFSWTSNYWNLTNDSGNNEKEWPQFNLGKQTVEGTLMRNYTCWVLQLPPEVAGTCKGIVSFTACKDGSCPEA